MFFLYLLSNRTYFKYFKMFKMAAILGFGRVFKPEVVREVESNSKIGHEILFDGLAQILGSYGYFKI